MNIRLQKISTWLGDSGIQTSARNRTLLLAFCILLACQGATRGGDRLPANEMAERTDQLAQAALEHGAVGLSIAVGYDGELVVSKGYGLAEVEHQVPTDANSVFRIASVTKQFTAALIMKRVDAGDIHLDDSINKFIDFPTGDHTVTIRHLLTHTSGIKSYTSLGKGWLRTVPLEFSHEELLGMVANKPFDFAPGERFLYNNTGYYLLGVILEKLSGKTYPELVDEQIAQPLGLTHTRYGSNEDIIPNRAEGYAIANGVLVNDSLLGMSQPGAAGALVSTAADLVRWQWALANGQVVSQESYKLMTTPFQLNDGSFTDYGFGLSLDESGELPSFRHGGGINGFTSMLALFPESNIGVAVISNSEAFNAAILANSIAEAAHKIATTP